MSNRTVSLRLTRDQVKYLMQGADTLRGCTRLDPDQLDGHPVEEQNEMLRSDDADRRFHEELVRKLKTALRPKKKKGA